ncbi:hypothetical protein NHX12_012547 [Muraenolepis orangiensis]|uniref:G-protein coupled receptors family 3 profile domain-containing protein n=1 Tax=Muraenolepis orangiensis TaxID=630683 RepID=A0A9Q0DD24_9TELE|nr:hypothetical protein NHX12_012547 [Muraenolepis orangiensis]
MSEGDSVGESIHGRPSTIAAFFTRLGQIYQSWLDKSTPFYIGRWAGTLLLTAVYMIRVYILQGWYIVTYALGIYHLNLFIAFLSPKVDPSMLDEDEGPSLPTKQNEEFRPFIRRLPEFKFWHSATKGIVIAMICTFFEAFNVPVFWPILVMYFIMLFCITMKRQIKHMINGVFNRGNYRRFQVMRFTVEEINNSTVLLPNVSLGYEILDHCSQMYNFPGVLDLISFNGSIRFPGWGEGDSGPRGKVVGVVGPFTSADSIPIAPLFTLKLIPMISFGAASSVLSNRDHYPAFLRTATSNKALVDLIIRVLQRFHWTWVAVLHSRDSYGTDGRDLCVREMAHTDICVAYTAVIGEKTNYAQLFRQLEAKGIAVIIVFSLKVYALNTIEAAVALNITDKVWVAADAWLFSKTFSHRSDIESIGTILGLSEKTVHIDGFDDFIRSEEDAGRSAVGHAGCNQNCSCDFLTDDDILAEDSSYNFQVYTATYALAHALHSALRCDRGGTCDGNSTVYPYMVLDELKKTNMTILNLTVQFNEKGGLRFPSMNLFIWTKAGVEQVGSYETTPTVLLSIDNSKLQWHTNGTVPVSDRPAAIDCSSMPFQRGNYRRFQVMRFTIEEINNSTVLLPNVSLGYEILDHCSQIYNFPGVLDLISFNGSIRFSWEASDYRPLGKVMGVVGPYTSSDSLAIASLFTLKLIPLISYGASSSALSCDSGTCNVNTTVYPYMVLHELKKTNLMIRNLNIQFNEKGGLKFPSMNIFIWTKGRIEKVGFYETTPTVVLSINNSQIQWHANGTVPVSVCSPECPVGSAKRPDGIHRCCFTCEICPNGTYLNVTKDAYHCMDCTKSEWSSAGSTSCKLRSVVYIHLTDPTAILIVVAAIVLAGLSLAIMVIFAFNYNTPVVKSAGGLMCLLILGCLSLSTISIFFYFDKPTTASCILRYLPFMFFYTACLACFVVRSFQIVCVFKMAAKFPKIYSWWMKYNGQWLLIAAPVLMQAILLTAGYASKPPQPFNDTAEYPDKIILTCGQGNFPLFSLSVILLSLLVVLCFAFSYMGKDLPKNYNEAKAITFCLLLLILTWVTFITSTTIYHGEHIRTLNALAVLSSLYSILLWYFLPKCYIVLFQPQKNTTQYFQGLIQDYTKQLSAQ